MRGFALILAALAFMVSASPANAQVRMDYAERDGRGLGAYVFAPPAAFPAPRPAILLFHGGGWVSGDASWVFTRAQRFAALGMVAIAVDYRLSDTKGTPGATPAAALEDACDAFRWARREHGKLGVLPDKIAGYGVSAGGHLAVMAGLGACGPEGVPNLLVLLSPALDLESDAWFGRILGRSGRSAEFSPLHLARGGAVAPPLILATGERDVVTPRAGLEAFCALEAALGGICETHFYPDAGHLLTRNLSQQEYGFDPRPEDSADVNARFEAFLSQHGY